MLLEFYRRFAKWLQSRIFFKLAYFFCMFQAQCHVLHDLHHDRGRHMILILSKYSWELAMNRRGASMNDIIRHSRCHGEKFQRRAQLSSGVQRQSDAFGYVHQTYPKLCMNTTSSRGSHPDMLLFTLGRLTHQGSDSEDLGKLTHPHFSHHCLSARTGATFVSVRLRGRIDCLM